MAVGFEIPFVEYFDLKKLNSAAEWPELLFEAQNAVECEQLVSTAQELHLADWCNLVFCMKIVVVDKFVYLAEDVQ